MSESDKSGKPELTAGDAKRIVEWVDNSWYAITHNTWDFAYKAAEWATLHERSAAQARIAELEAEVKVQYAKGWNDAISSAIETAHAFSSGCAAMEIEQQLQKKRIKRKKS